MAYDTTKSTSLKRRNTEHPSATTETDQKWSISPFKDGSHVLLPRGDGPSRCSQLVKSALQMAITLGLMVWYGLGFFLLMDA